MSIARFCRPSRELYIERHFYPRSALEDLLGAEATEVQTDRLYRGLEHNKVIQTDLRPRLGLLFELSFDLRMYDLTST